MKKTEKLLNIINDLIADNDFNTDVESNHNITIDIENLISELKITKEQLNKNQELR